jgi:hypothetical protein
MGVLVLAGMLALVIHAIGIVTFILVAQALGMSLSLAQIGLARAVMLAAALLPISVAGLGLREGAAVLVLGTQGESQEAAVAMSLLVFVAVWLLPGIVGALIETGELVGRRRIKADAGPGAIGRR